MRAGFIALIAVVLGAAAQTDRTGESSAIMMVVHQFVDSFNKGDTKTAAAACAEQTSIIDEFPPHEWHGVGGCAKWMAAYDADAKKRGITDGVVTLESPRHVDVSSNVAYVVVPANYSYKMNGNLVKESGSMLTLVLRRGAAGWRISGWSWSQN
jgi:ketosteroid isomerase-like protein